MADEGRRRQEAAQRTVLIVEDDSNTRRVLALLLELRGYEVVEAEDGRTGLGLALDGPADLVISDLQLPGMSGIDLARAFRGEDGRAPMIAITSGPESLVAEARESRLFSRVLRKPVDVNALLEIVEELSPRNGVGPAPP